MGEDIMAEVAGLVATFFLEEEEGLVDLVFFFLVDVDDAPVLGVPDFLKDLEVFALRILLVMGVWCVNS
jgi:hypothetical protein